MDVIQRILNCDPVHFIAACIRSPDDLNFVHPEFGSPLHIAVRQNDLHLVRMLLTLGASVDAMDLDGRNALHLAIELQAAVSIIITILKYQPKTDTVALSTKNYPLGIAATNDDIIRAELLLMAEACPNFQPNSPSASPPLTFAIAYGHIEMVKLLLYYGAYINYIDDVGQGYIELAVMSVFGTPDLEPPEFVKGILPLLFDNGCTIKTLDLEVVLDLYPPSTLASILQAYRNNTSSEYVQDIVVRRDRGGCEYNLRFLLQYYVLVNFNNFTKSCTALFQKLSKQAQLFYDKCVIELQQMSLFHVGDLKLIDIFLNMTSHVEPNYVQDLLENENLDELFPIYSADLRRVLDACIERYEVMETVSNQMYRILGFNIENVSRQICQYFSTFQLHKLNHVFGSNVEFNDSM